MSNDNKNISVDDVLKELSTNGSHDEQHNSSDIDSTSATNEKVSLEDLEKKRLDAISQGELSDFSINYSTYTNRPNKVIENPKAESPYFDKGVVKINSRPDRKEPINSKSKSRGSSHSKRHDNDMSGEEYNQMSERIRMAKAKKDLEINQLNAKYHVTAIPQETVKSATLKEVDELLSQTNRQPSTVQEQSTVESATTQEAQKSVSSSTERSKLKKTPLFNFSKKKTAKDTAPLKETDNTNSSETLEPAPKTDVVTTEVHNTDNTKTAKPKKKPVFSLRSKAKTLEDSSLVETSKDTKSEKPKKEPKGKSKGSILQRIINYYTIPVDEDEEYTTTNTKIEMEQVTKSQRVETIEEPTPQVEVPQEPTPQVEVPQEPTSQVEVSQEPTPQVEATDEPKKKETVKEFIVDLFTTKDKAPAKKKETFKERMIEFFTVEDEEEEFEESSNVTPNDSEVSIKKDTVATTETIKEDFKENILERVPSINDIIESSTEAPKLEDTPNTVEQSAEAPKSEETPNTVEQSAEAPKSEDTPNDVGQSAEAPKKLSLFRRIQEFFLAEENTNDAPNETTSTASNVLATDDRTETIEGLSDDRLITKELTKQNIEDATIQDEHAFEETVSESIDVPVDTEPTYEHFWQDPDLNVIDRIKLNVHNATERHRNRKRSGEIHIEIKSTTDTGIKLYHSVSKQLLAEERMEKVREEFKEQVKNGEYDDFSMDDDRVAEDEPTFNSNSVNDFNSYDDKSKILEYFTNMGNGLLLRTIITTMLAIMSVYIALANDLGLPIFDTVNAETSASGYLIVQGVLGLVTMLVSIKAIFSGIVNIFKNRADCDSFASIGIVSAFISDILILLTAQNLIEEKVINVYMPVAIVGVLFNIVGKTLIVKRGEHNFKYISKKKDKYGLFCMQDDYDAEKITHGLVEDYPITAYSRKSKFTKDFLKYTYSYDMADRFSKYAIPVIGVVSLIVSIIASIVYNSSFEMLIPVGIFSIFSMLVSFCSCYGISISINHMLYLISKKYARREGAMLGYQAVEDFYDTNSVVLDANSIFPKGSVSLNSMKLFSGCPIDEALIYAMSLAKSTNSILTSLLLPMAFGDDDMIKPVENCSYEDGLGVCGWIENKRILMGNRELMEAHNIEGLPTKSEELSMLGKDMECVYISISGNLALMLVVSITANKKVMYDLQNFEDHGIAMAVVSQDFLVSVNKISRLFDISEDSIKIVSYNVYNETKEYFGDKDTCSTSIVTGGDMGILMNMLLNTKRVHFRAMVGNILFAVSCIVGIIIGISFITMGAFRELTSTMLLVYNLICSVIVLILTKLKRL